MRDMPRLYLPAALMGLGCLLLFRIHDQSVMPLRAPLASAVPKTIGGYSSQDLTIDPEEKRVAGVSDYLLRVFRQDSAGIFSVYVGFYEEQGQGRSIHSPKNCLPGAGWEPVEAGTATFPAGVSQVTVNRYVIEKAGQRALVYYWYQGRGRVAWNEFAVKWDLLRDKAVQGRSEEALVRLVIPWDRGRPDLADSLARAIGTSIVGPIMKALPAPPASRGDWPGT